MAKDTASSGRIAASKKARRSAVPTDPISVDSESLYLKEIEKVRLLTAAEEAKLAKRIEAGAGAGVMLERARSGDVELDCNERERLERIVQAGSDAKQRMFEANLRLVVSIARRYKNRGMAFEDLVQEGSIGLMKAIEKFEWRHGFKFSSFATWWIRQAITRAIAGKANTVRDV